MSTARVIVWLLALVTVVALIAVWVEQSKSAESGDIEDDHSASVQNDTDDQLWQAPLPETISDLRLREIVLYGKDLIAHTARYFGPNGLIAKTTNGMNCQNCHLDAGTKPWGNNYGSVASTYPKYRARSGGMEDVYKRVADCFERSLNGKAPDTNSREMVAIRAYIEFLGSNVKKGEKAKGSGLKELAMLDRPADPVRGKVVYEARCQSCHQADGQGIKHPDGVEYLYPPLWGKNSYNDAAGLYRIINFARYVKYNMPLGASHTMPMLTDEEAWDVAAFVNSQQHPHKEVPFDWPDVSQKPPDHPFGPYADSFSQHQHKFGPWQPIISFYKQQNQTSPPGK